MEIDRLQKIIESCHLNFLIGSGASKKYLETLFNIETLLTDLDNENSFERESISYKILETSIRYWYFDKCMRGNLKLVKSDFTLTDEKEQEFNDTVKTYEDFIQALNIILLKRKTNLLNKQVNIFTTNMDVFLDKVLDKLGIEFNDGFSGKFESVFKTSNYQKSIYKSSAQYDVNSELPLFNLFKLHGSLTWDKINQDKILYDAQLTTLTNLNKFKFDNGQLISLFENNKYKSFEELKEEAESKNKLDNYDKFKTEYEKLIMINPTKEKFESTTLRLEYYEQMRMYSNVLEKENTVLFVTGFSFADEHIKEITLRALNSNPTLLICVFCFNEVDKIKIDTLFAKLKFNNLYTNFIDYSFQKTTTDIFEQIAKKLDTNFYGKIEGEDINTKNENKK